MGNLKEEGKEKMYLELKKTKKLGITNIRQNCS